MGQLPTIQDGDGNDMGVGFSEKEENGGGQSSNPTQQETNEENLRNVESGGDGLTIIEEIDGLVGEERMELREEQVQMVRKMKKKKKRKNMF